MLLSSKSVCPCEPWAAPKASSHSLLCYKTCGQLGHIHTQSQISNLLIAEHADKFFEFVGKGWILWPDLCMEDVPEHIIFILSAASKGSEPRDHLIENDAVAPPVCSLAVLTACLNLKHFLILKILHKTVSYIREYHQNLRSHVVRSATEGCGHVRSWKVFLAHSKVSNFHVALSVQEYVVKLEIPTLICIHVNM